MTEEDYEKLRDRFGDVFLTLIGVAVLMFVFGIVALLWKAVIT